jgi:predicted ATPase
MAEVLLEREAQLEVLAGAVTEGGRGHGSTALIAGEAGIGKTSLVRALAGRVGAEARVLMAACDDLVASRTLGPLHDAAVGSAGPLAAALADQGAVDRVFPALLEELAEERPTVLIVEDLHWADDATLDVLGYAARRVETVGAVLVLTMRDELDPRHPLRRLLGALTGCPVHRIELAPLSRHAVQALAAGSGRDPAAVYALTRGNPSSSPRRWPRPATRCRPASRTRCWPACADWTATAARRSSACRWCPRASRPSWPPSCWGKS